MYSANASSRNLGEMRDLGMFPATIRGETGGRCLPVVTKEDIDDRSKADSFTKAFACLQCAWLVIQSITRACAGLPITELELMTLAFIVAAVLMYGFWWYKPFDVQRPTVLICPEKNCAQFKAYMTGKQVLDPHENMDRPENMEVETPLYLFSDLYRFKFESLSKFSSSLLFILIGTIFSGVHVIAWNWDFPSWTVRILWRVFSVMALGSPLTTLALVMTAPCIMNNTQSDWRGPLVFVVGAFSFLVVYPLSRLELIVLTFYCFSSMPAAVYQTVDWNSIFPHFS